MSENTITVTWTTLVEETYTATMPRAEYDAMVDAGTFADDLAEWEDDGPTSTDVTGREIESAS